METKRIYEHKDHGRIGHVELVTPEGKWTLDGKELPKSTIEHLTTFALQSLQDSYAGATDKEDAIAKWTKKRDAMYAGTVGTRGGGVTNETMIGRRLARVVLKAKSSKDEYKAFGELEVTDQNAKLDKIVAANAEYFDKAIKKEIAMIEAKRKANASMADEVKIDI